MPKTLKVGDRVVYKYNGSENTHGTIVKISKSHYSTRLNKRLQTSHQVLFDNGNCYWYLPAELQLLPKPKPKKKEIKAWAIVNNSGFPLPKLAVNWIDTPFGVLKSKSMVRIYLDKHDAEEDRMKNSKDVIGLLSVIEVSITLKGQKQTKSK